MLAEEKCDVLFNDIEIPLVGVLADMECEGIALDTSALSSFSKELEIDLLKLQEEIYKLAGVDFNIDSPKQLGFPRRNAQYIWRSRSEHYIQYPWRVQCEFKCYQWCRYIGGNQGGACCRTVRR